MRIVQSTFSADYARIIVHFGTKEFPVVFGPYARPLPNAPRITDPLVGLDVEVCIGEIVAQTGQPEDVVCQAVIRYLAGAGRYTTPEDWYHRFKAAGGRGKVDGVKIWFGESGPQTNESTWIIAELIGPGKEDAHREVVEYLQSRFTPGSGWADF